MARVIFLLFLFGLCQGQVKDADQDLATLLQEIFGKVNGSDVDTLKKEVNTEETLSISITQCQTADGKEGSCTIPSGCSKKLSPLILSDKDICLGTEEICCSLDDISLSSVKSTLVAKSGCGWRNGGPVQSKVQSDVTEFAEFPWIVAVLKVVPASPEKPEGSKVFLYTCGGSVIHPRVVVTAAHNVQEKDIKLRARAGEWDTTSDKEVLPYQDRNVERLIIHEMFNTVRTNLFYDVALLVLDKPLDFVLNVNSICLPPVNQRAVDGTRCISAGWGKKQFGKAGAYQTLLKKVDIPVIDRKKCVMELRKTRLGPLFKLHSTFMCAGGEANKDTCTGDGGSPLMCPIDGQAGRYVASGMVAWGLGCGDEVPAVYADVGALRPWIDAKMTELGFGQDSYTY